MGLKIQEKLFDIKSLEIDSKYITPSEKRKWTISFTKWCIVIYHLRDVIYNKHLIY